MWWSETFPDWNGIASQEGNEVVLHGDFGPLPQTVQPPKSSPECTSDDSKLIYSERELHGCCLALPATARAR